MSELDLREEPYDAPVAAALIEAVQLEYVERYGGPDESPVQPGEFSPPHGRFLVGYAGTAPVAMGGLRRVDPTTVEIKRMYVVPDHRGKGTRARCSRAWRRRPARSAPAASFWRPA